MRSPLRTVQAAVVATVALLGLAACGGGSDDTGDSGGSAGSSGGSTTTKVIDVTFDGDSVTPNGDRVPVDVDQRIELHVTADKAGEIHVHSTPEQELEYAKGTTTLKLKIDKPGLIEVESHALDKTIVQLEVG